MREIAKMIDKTETRLLIAYWMAGAICGILTGALMAGVEIGSCYLESFLTLDVLMRRIDEHDMVFALTLLGLMMGISFAPFWRIAPMIAALGGHPICAASMGGSLVGLFWLLFVPAGHPQWLEPTLVPVLLAHLFCTLGLGALYGFLLALLVRPLRRWLVPDVSGSR